MKREFTAVYEKRGKWYVAYLEEVPGVNTQGKTIREAKRNLKEAARLILVTNREILRKSLLNGAQTVVKEPIFIGMAK